MLICPSLKSESVPVENLAFGLFNFTDADSGVPFAVIGNNRPEVDTDSRALYKVYYNIDGSYIGREVVGELSKEDVADVKKGKIAPHLSERVQDHLKNPGKYSKEIGIAKTHVVSGERAHGVPGSDRWRIREPR
ncbi:MAG: hypothetical protein JO025_12515 [Verrucomicrobia bacterium]|nr:hypothetical protein [Verrucomicrobiota bacterium]